MGATCYEAWKTLVKKVGGSPNTWKDLGYTLGIKQEDLDVCSVQYVMNLQMYWH